MILWNLIKKSLIKSPWQIISEKDRTFNYKSIIDFCETFSRELKNIKCCAILCKSELSASLGLLSCFAAGVTAVPLSVRYGEIHCNKILDTIGPDAIITDDNDELQVIHLNKSTYKKPLSKPTLIMCTSGTSGTPKGAILTEKNIITNIKDISKYFNVCENDAILISRPLYHCAVLTGEFLLGILKGMRICFYSEQFNPKSILDIITNKKISVFCGTPTIFRLLSRFEFKSKLKTICISGECLSESVGKQIAKAFPNTNIYHVYGLTEAAPRISYLPPNLFKNNCDCVGYALQSVKYKIIKENGELASTDEEGILWVKGNNIMSGYYNAPDLTKRVLKRGWLCTGDIATITGAGLLKIKGRNDDLIIRAGMNIYPQEVEGILKIDQRVQEVLVYKIQTPKGVNIALKIAGNFSSIDDVKKMCSELLPAFQIPSHIELLNELPKNGSGKIIRS